MSWAILTAIIIGIFFISTEIAHRLYGTKTPFFNTEQQLTIASNETTNITISAADVLKDAPIPDLIQNISQWFDLMIKFIKWFGRLLNFALEFILDKLGMHIILWWWFPYFIMTVALIVFSLLNLKRGSGWLYEISLIMLGILGLIVLAIVFVLFFRP